MSSHGALSGLKVVDLTNELGRFATKLVAEAGADVVKIAGWGSPGLPMRDAAAAARGGLNDWWFDGGKARVVLDLDDGAGQSVLRDLAARADLVFDDLPPGWLAERGIDYPELSANNGGLVHVSLTPFGRTGPRANWHGSDLVAAALGGVSSLTGPPDKPLNSWGRQNYNFGCYVALISGLAARWCARRTGRGQHVDVSLHEAVTGSLENLFFQYWFHDLLPTLPKVAPRQGSLHWAGAYQVVPARRGSIMVTPTPVPEPLLQWMADDGFDAAREFLGVGVLDLIPRMAEIMALIAEWAKGKDAGPLFTEAQDRHIAFGEVQDVPTVAANPQFAFRSFFEDYAWDGPAVRRPGHPARLTGTPPPPLRPPTRSVSATADIASRWGAVRGPGPDASVIGGRKPLHGVTVVDFTWVLAGPFATRMLGDLGADVVKVQTEERATAVNKDDYPYYSCWNRSKRSVMLNMKHPRALQVARSVIEHADVLIENYSAGVLARWGLGWDQVHAWNPRLVYVTMAGCGQDGPWANVISYAPTVHALSGLTYLTNPADRRDVGPGFSLNDHAAGFVAAALLLEALEARERTGEGQLIDMAQLEVGSFSIGPALLDYFANGCVAEPDGNGDFFEDLVPNDTYRSADGAWVAVSATEDAMWTRLCQAIGRTDLAEDPTLATGAQRLARRAEIDEAVAAWTAQHSAAAAAEALQAAGVAAGPVQDAPALMADPQHLARGFWQTVTDHPHFGTRPFDRFPAQFSASSLEPYLRSPYFGEANFDVYTTLAGLSEEEVAVGIGDGLFT